MWMAHTLEMISLAEPRPVASIPRPDMPVVTRKLLALAAAIEAATGITLIVSPPFVAWLLLRTDVAGAGVHLGRVGGFGLLALAIACWPSAENAGSRTHVQALRAMLIYNSLAAAYLAYLRVGSGFSGILLWPAIVLHAVLALLFARAVWKESSQASPRRNS